MKQMTDSPLSSPSNPQIHVSHRSYNYSCTNVFHLLSLREISPREGHVSKMRWGEPSKLNAQCCCKLKVARDTRHGLFSWVEAESLGHLSAKYCSLVPPPRSTIAASFSQDGRTLASTHGDHTVKIIDCQTGRSLKVLSGHRRTPWVVRFHPLYPEILASGSLDHEVRLWDANTSDCIVSREFYRPIASIAFHADGEFLAVATGHKLYTWRYNKRGEGSSPTMVLKTRRSLRAVQFHPLGYPFLLTAEVNDLDSDSSMTRATSHGYLNYPPLAVVLANVHSSERLSLATELPLMSLPCLFLPYARDYSRMNVPRDNRLVGSSASSSYPGADNNINNYLGNELQNVVGDSLFDAMETTELQPLEENLQRNSISLGSPLMGSNIALLGEPGQISTRTDTVQSNNFLPGIDPTCWELPFLHGLLIGQGHTEMPMILPFNGGTSENLSRYFGVNTELPTHNIDASAGSLGHPGGISSGFSGRSSPPNSFARLGLGPISDSRELSASRNESPDGTHIQSIIRRIQAELATSLATAATAELPCTVKLRIWSYDVKNPCALLSSERSRLTISHAVLCSEMGTHFSPCGRFLVACVACMHPYTEADPGLQMQIHYDFTGATTSPTRHPISAQQLMYELRIYSLEESTFGSVLISRAIRAAHCLTSIQFSPTSEHILLAYGRRHSSLLKTIVIDGDITIPIYTILEIYRVSDMELVKVISSADDEVNVACFHPLPGGGLIYGTKEGKLRILQYDNPHDMDFSGPNTVLEENMVELRTYALDC